jgi:hypothetical protein
MTLVDASSWIEFLRGRDSQPSQRVKILLVRDDAAWCDFTLVELWHGARGQKEKSALEELESTVRLYPVNEEIWITARRLARKCREVGVTVPSGDIVIAACAVGHELALEHNDEHFNKILPVATRL